MFVREIFLCPQVWRKKLIEIKFQNIKVRKIQRQKLRFAFKQSNENRNHAKETAHKYLANSLLHFSIHTEHASISCCSREHFLFDFEPLHDVRRFLYLSREKSERKGKVETKKTLHTHWTSVSRSLCCCCKPTFLVDSNEHSVLDFRFTVIQSSSVFLNGRRLAPYFPS